MEMYDKIGEIYNKTMKNRYNILFIAKIYAQYNRHYFL